MEIASAPSTTVTARAAGLRRGFETLDAETRIDSLPVEGEVPAWLTGSLVRTGPAKFEAGGREMRLGDPAVVDAEAVEHRQPVEPVPLLPAGARGRR